MEHSNLDLRDRKILYELDLNSRRPNVKIAKKIGLSKDVINYRIKKLEQLGFIRGYYTVIDFSRLGYFSIRVYIKLLDTTLTKEQEILDFLVKHKKVFFVAEIDGPFDIAFGTWIKNIYEFEEFYLDFKKLFKQYIGKERISVFTKAHHFHRAYITSKKIDESEPEYFGSHAIAPHDKIDLEILKLLSRNARVPVIEISQRLRMPPRTVAFRIKQLEKKGIIQGYRFIFDFNLLGYQYYKVDLTLKDVTRLRSLIQFAHINPNILYIDQTIGGADFEFDLEVENKDAFIRLIRDLREKFPEVREWSYFVLRKYNKLLYFPDIS